MVPAPGPGAQRTRKGEEPNIVQLSSSFFCFVVSMVRQVVGLVQRHHRHASAFCTRCAGIISLWEFIYDFVAMGFGMGGQSLWFSVQ